MSWSTDVSMYSRVCPEGWHAPYCEDTSVIQVSAETGSGETLFTDVDSKTAYYEGWDTRTGQETVSEAPTQVTYHLTGSDYNTWGCDASINRCYGGPKFVYPSVTYTYNVSDDVVVSTLDANDPDDSDALSYSIVSDTSGGIFSIRGNQLILMGGSSVSGAGSGVYDLVIGITDSNGDTTQASVSVDISDAGGVAQQITQQLNGTEDSAFNLASDFSQGTISSADLPSWLSLVDAGNGQVTLAGTAPNSGQVTFSLTSTHNGRKTTSNYTLDVSDSCTSAYCASFASSANTVDLSSYTASGGNHYVDSTQYYGFSSWSDLQSALNAGTGVFERTGITMDAASGDWEGNLRLSVDFSNRQIDATAWGTFANYGSNSGSYNIQEQSVFDTSNANCSAPGQCSLFNSPSSALTCTGGTCDSGQTIHSNVDLAATGSASLLTDQSSSYAMIGSLQLQDTLNSNTTVASTAGNGLVLEAQ